MPIKRYIDLFFSFLCLAVKPPPQFDIQIVLLRFRQQILKKPIVKMILPFNDLNSDDPFA